MDSKQFTQEYNNIIKENKTLPDDLLIDEKEAERAIGWKMTPEEYFDYKMKLKYWPISKGKWDCLKFDE